MNSFGSVSLVSHAIYRVLHHLNWFSNEDDANNSMETNDTVEDMNVESEQT